MGPAGLGFQEILLIAVLLLIFVRPEELPAIFRKIGKLWARVYYYYTLAKRELRAMNARMRSEIANFDRTVKDDTVKTKTNPNTDKEE
jgi:Sec-independent protein translocase protein TatA